MSVNKSSLHGLPIFAGSGKMPMAEIEHSCDHLNPLTSPHVHQNR
jgi:hypothetical protein